MLFGKGKGEDPLALLQQGKFKEAAKVLEARLQRSPHDLSLKMRLAEAYEGAGRKADAAAIYVAEADADISGGDRSQALGLLKKASRLLPADEDLKARILKLEGQPETSSDQSFSFDVDMSSSPDAEEPPAPEMVPDAVEASAGELAAAAEEPAPSGEEAEVEVEVETDFAMSSAEQPAAPAQAFIEAPPPETAEAPEVAAEEGIAAAGDGAEVLEAGVEHLEPVGVEAEEQPPEGPRVLLARLFPELDDSHLDLLESVAREGWVNAGKVLIREEEPGDSLFVVASGRFEARGHFDGRELLLASFGPGELIGEVAFLNRVPRTATVTAVDDSTYVELPGDEVREQLAGSPESLALLESILNERVERTLRLLKQAGWQPDDNP